MSSHVEVGVDYKRVIALGLVKDDKPESKEVWRNSLKKNLKKSKVLGGNFGVTIFMDDCGDPARILINDRMAKDASTPRASLSMSFKFAELMEKY